MENKLKPVGKRVLVKVPKQQESKGQFQVSGERGLSVKEYEIIAVGRESEFKLYIGKIAIMSPNSGKKILYEGEEYKVVGDFDILLIKE